MGVDLRRVPIHDPLDLTLLEALVHETKPELAYERYRSGIQAPADPSCLSSVVSSEALTEGLSIRFRKGRLALSNAEGGVDLSSMSRERFPLTRHLWARAELPAEDREQPADAFAHCRRGHRGRVPVSLREVRRDR